MDTSDRDHREGTPRGIAGRTPPRALAIASAGEAYGRLAAWLKDHDREASGAAWEVYGWIEPNQKLDPATWPAPAEWRTELIQPIA